MSITDRVRSVDGRRVEIVGGMRRRWSDLPGLTKLAALVALMVLLYSLPLLDPPLLTTPDSDFPTVLFSV